MKTFKNTVMGVLLAGFLSLPAISSASAAELATVTGVVNKDYQIETSEGAIYEILESEKGVEVFEMTGKTVRVTGEVEEVDGDRLILILSYEVLPSPAAEKKSVKP